MVKQLNRTSEMSTNLTDNITPWLTRDIVAYLRQVNIRTISDFCDANCANLTRMTRLPIEHIRASRSLLMALIETRLINGAELFKPGFKIHLNNFCVDIFHIVKLIQHKLCDKVQNPYSSKNSALNKLSKTGLMADSVWVM